ncbi:alpha-2-macroglobulin [Hyalangium rubrum]|uniref:MG2 domain-containing protein n=1 Tax=Hyalangium rubrum TaxID=3103134 RepID=A0ABU5HK48_9BACT|nr:MG2 domain-containing protein [Hyalangium sp. s54d21]MDY7233218.1 MG2 domain-containing protein [Hyalangium sp. s54d21]
MSVSPSAAALLALLAVLPAAAQDYRPADESQRPQGGQARILPEQFLRGFDPVTVYFSDNVGPGKRAADDGAKLLKLTPSWPGQYFWADKKTLQFRPAEPWPPLQRFAFEARDTRKVLATMMSAPSAMAPYADSTDLRPFRTLTLTFPQPLPLAALKQMLTLEIRELPGLADSPTRVVKDFTLSQLPRESQRSPAVYAITLDEDVPEGRQLRVTVSLALGEEDKVLWTGRLSTRPSFHLQSIQCGSSSFGLVGGASVPKDMALSCGNQGDLPQLVFSANVQDLTLTALKKLVRLEPAVPDLHFQSYGSRVSLRGRFVPDTLYRLQIAAAPIQDDSGRSLRDPGNAQVFFHLGWKTAFLRWSQANALVEAKGPRMLPLQGYGDARADVRIYRIDPLHEGIWPFPERPVVINEESAPPFPGEEPATPENTAGYIGPEQLKAHIRLLGSPLVSRVVELPLANKSGTTSFGLDLGPLLDEVVGRQRPGTYLVGLRRLTGAPERSYVRVQVTNLSLTAVEERDRAVFFVRTLDEAKEVRGARILLEGQRRVPDPARPGQTKNVPFSLPLTTDDAGRASLGPQADWQSLKRISVQSGDDLLVLDPRSPPATFARNHWSPSSGFLEWIGQQIPPPRNDALLGFIFTERPIYKPGEKVFIKGYVRRKTGGELQLAGGADTYELRVEGPGDQRWPTAATFTALGGFSAEFTEKDVPTGEFHAVLREKKTGQEVARRKFMIEAYRVPQFEVQLSGPNTARLDAPFKVKAVARYYAGGNVAGQPIAWTVTRRPHYYVPKGREGFLFASSTQFAREGQSRAPDVIRRNVELDDSGADELQVNPALDLDGSARVYRFEATVTGADNQPVSAVTEVKALPPFTLGMKLPRYSDKPFELKPEILAIGVDDKPVKGQDVTVRLFRRVWHSQLRETHFATGDAKYVTEQEDIKLSEQVVATDTQPVGPTLTLKEAGVYVVELIARDKLGRVQTLFADLYVGGQTPVAWKKPRQGVFELATDKPKYRPGDTARIIIQSPFQQGRALVVVEEPGGNTYTWREVSGGKAVYELPIKANHTPNIAVHVALMRGRLGEGKTEDARYRPQTLGASIDIEVEPSRNEVKVELKHPEVARPGTKIPVEVFLKDDRGAPLSGEVTLWLVDEAVLSLASEGPLDPLSAFITRNARGTTVRDTRNSLIGKLFDQEDPGGDGAEEEEANATGSKRVVRKNFQTVPYYQATLQVPASGKLTVEVPLSDDLTNFRVRAVAASGSQRFGFKQQTLKVRLPVLVQPQLPRFVRQGDRFWGGAVGRVVEGSGGAGAVSMQLSGPVEARPFNQAVELQLNRAMSFVTPIQVKDADVSKPQSLTVRVDVERKSDKAGDAFEVQLPVLPDRLPEQFAYFDTLKAGKATLKPIPEPARPGTVSQQVLATSVPGVLEVFAGVEYLAAYPHGCLEQKLSKLYPDVEQGVVFRRIGLETAFAKQLGLYVKRIQEEMVTYQDPSGLFAFWPGGPGDVQVTALAVEFLNAAARAGFPVDTKMQERASEALKRVLRSDYGGLNPDWRFNQRVVALRALSHSGLLDEHYLVDLFHQRERMDSMALADLASTMSIEPKTYRTNLDSLKGELWDRVIVKLRSGKQVFEGVKEGRSSWSYGFLSSQPAMIAAVFEALLRLDPADPRHDLMRDALLAQANPVQGFQSTYENRRAIGALALYLDRAKPNVPNSALALSVGKTLTVNSETKTARTSFASDKPLEATVTGGPVGVRVAYQYVPATPGDKVTSLQRGFLVSRSATHLHADGSDETRFQDKAGETQALKVGDILEIHAQLVSDQARNHVAFVVPFAAGLEPLNPALENASSEAKPSQADSITPAYVQRLDNEVRYYFLQLPQGTHTFHFRVRAATEGSFVHPAPYAEQMYRQDVRGRGEGLRIVVKGEHEQ